MGNKPTDEANPQFAPPACSALEWEGDISRTSLGVYSIARSYVREGAMRTTEWEVHIIGAVRLVGIGGTKKEARAIAQRDYDAKAQNDLASRSKRN